MSNSPLISRKELAMMCGVSVSTVKRKEKVWGLSECRSGANKSTALFFRSKAIAALKKSKACEI